MTRLIRPRAKPLKKSPSVTSPVLGCSVRLEFRRRIDAITAMRQLTGNPSLGPAELIEDGVLARDYWGAWNVYIDLLTEPKSCDKVSWYPETTVAEARKIRREGHKWNQDRIRKRKK